MIFTKGNRVKILRRDSGLDVENNPICGQTGIIEYVNGEYHYVRLVSFPIIQMELYRYEIALI